METHQMALLFAYLCENHLDQMESSF